MQLLKSEPLMDQPMYSLSELIFFYQAASGDSLLFLCAFNIKWAVNVLKCRLHGTFIPVNPLHKSHPDFGLSFFTA